MNDKMNDRLTGRCGVDRRPEGRENWTKNFGRNNQNLLLKLWGTSQDGGGGGVGGVKVAKMLLLSTI